MRGIQYLHTGKSDRDGDRESHGNGRTDERTRCGRRGDHYDREHEFRGPHNGVAQIAITNKDSVEHSVTSDTEGKFSVDVEGNGKGTLTAPTEPGEYAIHCKYHPSMHGTLTVK
jgi:hypothetical protein